MLLQPNIRDRHKTSLYTYAKIVETWVAMDYPALSDVGRMLDVSPEVCGKAVSRYLNKGVKEDTTLPSKINYI